VQVDETPHAPNENVSSQTLPGEKAGQLAEKNGCVEMDKVEADQDKGLGHTESQMATLRVVGTQFRCVNLIAVYALLCVSNTHPHCGNRYKRQRVGQTENAIQLTPLLYMW
jgi:hypothetical protein